MKSLDTLISWAGKSPLHRWLLNRVLYRIIPFNAPHRIRIRSAKPGQVQALLPYRRTNLNHLKGIHACALASLCEYVSGLSLATMLPQDRFRVIMKSLHVEYQYQARMDVQATGILDEQQVAGLITGPLEREDAITFIHEVETSDVAGNLICIASVQWQVKKWDKVRSK